MATAASAKRVPSAFTIASAIRSALPVLTKAPANTPDVKMRRMLGTMDCAPEIIAATMSARPPPPSKPPSSAPIASAYTGVDLLTISNIATASPVSAPQVENI